MHREVEGDVDVDVDVDVDGDVGSGRRRGQGETKVEGPLLDVTLQQSFGRCGPEGRSSVCWRSEPRVAPNRVTFPGFFGD